VFTHFTEQELVYLWTTPKMTGNCPALISTSAHTDWSSSCQS